MRQSYSMQIIIKNYDPIWKELFKIERDRIFKAIEFAVPCIEHIGSTSIDDMIAKPIIDILIGLPDIGRLNDIIDPITSLGYTYIKKFEQDTPNRRFFILFDGFKPKLIDRFDEFPSDNQLRKFHVHVFEKNSKDWIRHLALRDYLRIHDSEKKAYKILKYNLSKQDFKGTLDYSKAKSEFLTDLERKALCWYTNKNQ
jgi:GrpB-like predicted nucleotidyltransferase (UPF0157 family)